MRLREKYSHHALLAWRGLSGAGACRKPLQFDDIWELPAFDKVENITANFEKYWQQEMQKQKPSLVRNPNHPTLTQP